MSLILYDIWTTANFLASNYQWREQISLVTSKKMDTYNSAYFLTENHGTQMIKKDYSSLMVWWVYSAGFLGFHIKDSFLEPSQKMCIWVF